MMVIFYYKKLIKTLEKIKTRTYLLYVVIINHNLINFEVIYENTIINISFSHKRLW